MKTTVIFNSAKSAALVVQYLYHVVQDSEKLIFSEFDEAAFKTAVALAGLKRTDYGYEGDAPLFFAVRTGAAPRVFGRPRFTLDFTLEAPENHYHQLCLNVMSDTGVTSSNQHCEFLIAIDAPLFHLLRILQRTTDSECELQKREFARIAANLESACLLVRNTGSLYSASVCGSLIICGSGRSQTISFTLFDVSFNRNVLSFE